MRLVFVALSFTGGVSVLAYLVLIIVMVPDNAPVGSSGQVLRDIIESTSKGVAEAAEHAAEGVRRVFQRPSTTNMETAEGRSRPIHMKNNLAFVLILIGALSLAVHLGVFQIRWGLVWPIILIAIGLGILMRRNRI